MVNEKIVISGIAGVFPNTKNVAELYDNLESKAQSLNKVDPYWQTVASDVPSTIGKYPLKEKFDAGFFGKNSIATFITILKPNTGVHHKQAEEMHNSCRKLLELAVEAILDSGVNLIDLKGTNTGVFVACSEIEVGSEWIWRNLSSPNFGIIGSTKSEIAGWISYCLELQGPSVVIDAACCSSHYALDCAVKSIQTGKCDNALVCGKNVIQNLSVHNGFHKLGVLEVNGNSNVFDDSCNGYIRSESVAVVFVQKVLNAKRVYAEILNIKTNCDGFKDMGIVHPSDEMIASLIYQVYNEVEIDPINVSYVECHCTGTVIGAVQEINAIEKAFCFGRSTPLPIGSVKCNLGHCEGASGLVSLIKILLGLQQNCILPNPNYKLIKSQLNALQNGKIVIATERISLPTEEDVIIGCNNHGFGGTNGHVALKHYNILQSSNQLRNPTRLVCFSGRTMSSLKNIFSSLVNNPTEEYVTLLQNTFRHNIYNHWYKGYAILQNKQILEKHFRCCNEKAQLCLIYTESNQKWLSVYNTITKIPTLSKSIERIRNVFWSKGVDVVQLWNSKHDLDCGDLAVATVALQIAVNDLFQDLLQEKIAYVKGFSIGVLTSAYANKTLLLEDVVEIVLKLRHRLKLIHSEVKYSFLEKTNLKPAPNVIKVIIGSGKNDGQFYFNSNTSLLKILGRFYVLGFNLNFKKLYPSISWPVKAPLISPLIEWHHEENWHVLKYQLTDLSKHVVTISVNHSDWKFLKGHVVDDRNLLPGAAYLFIVWKCYLYIKSLLMNETNILFEDVKFYRSSVLSKKRPLILTVNLTKIQNRFEIIEDNECLVTGKISSPTADFELDTNFLLNTKSQKTMDTRDIYKKLNLHGYNYMNEFCCLDEVNLDGTIGSIKWYNWVTLLDGVQQFILLNKELDYLNITTGIERLSIDPKKHAEALNNHKTLPINYHLNCNMVSLPGVEIRNIILSNTKKHSTKAPALEIHKFVPFDTDLSLENSVKVHIQLVLENLTHILRLIEIIDLFTSETDKILCPIIANVLENEYPVKKNLSIYSNKPLNCLNINVEYNSIDDLPPELDLLIMSRGSQRLQTVAQILEKRNCFILSRENQNFEMFKHVEVISVHRTETEKLVLLRKSCEIPRRVIKIKSDFIWLEQLKTSLHENEKVLLVAENDSTSGILGLVNCLKQEVGQLVSSVFVPDQKLNVEDYFCQSQLRKGLLVNIFKNGQWGSYRHFILPQDQKNCEHAFGTTVSGDLSSLQYLEGPLSKEYNKDLIDIYYAGVNFKDVVIATGKIKLSKQYRSDFENIGFEFAGVDSRNQRVMGVSSNGSFSNLISASNVITCSVPQEWSLEDAATVPVTYLTVLYAFFKVGRLKRGQSILVHSGTGGIGQSAINIALYYNCKIFTTVGSEEKRNYLKTLYPTIPDCHIGNSRDTSFENLILKQTNGTGVDLILNSLSEDKLLASTRCLARKGILLELGKVDLQLNNPLFLSTFRNNRVYSSISFDIMIEKHSNKVKQLMTLLEHGIEEGYIKPLPRVVYPKEKLQNALSYMNLGKHTGKIVIKFKDDSVSNQLPMRAKPRFFCHSTKVYILIGGLGGFGIELADWLISRGAQKLILISRSGVTNGYQNYKLRCWKMLGIKVMLAQEDVTTKEGCIKLLAETNYLGVVDGIFNLSVVLHDASIENQTDYSFKTVFAPKVLITKNMDTVSKKLCPFLRYFVVFSSVTCGRGNSDLTNYGMANSIAERICEERKRQGYPALAIQWGLIGDVGILAEKYSSTEEINGIAKQKLASCLNVMDIFLTQEEPVVSSAVFKNTQIKHKASSDDLLTNIVEILGHVSTHAKLSSLGMDSFSIVQLRQYLSTKCNIFFSLRELRNTTLHTLVQMSNATKM
ncbi:hypothetical protein RN001_010680 [Aquatica leii]|uniref:Ketosynthase family 3 (KS3) domain-containing protein n=1 Tax=Aquatica leii TaxID=1421715 RepID=A0AAN7SG68_9COLE|nr:hypothetical protein RN001_010680 [Aquatica leii]